MRLRRLGCLVLMLTLASGAQAAAPDGKQTRFATPEQAADALAAASQKGQLASLLAILGPGSWNLISSGDPVADRTSRERFLAAWRAGHQVKTEGERATVTVGEEEWPLPIPIVHEAKGWRFDARAGEMEILARRIGKNELDAIEVMRAYVDAQRDYAAAPRDGPLLHYARKFESQAGKHDGLYWPSAGAEPESPMGPLIAQARVEGYRGNAGRPERTPYHGYLYRVLTAQGPHAAGGPYDYLVNGQLLGGFALVAFPAKYGASGVMTFIVNQDGVVYQRDLGRDTEKLALAMPAFDPDPAGWREVTAGQSPSPPR
jgi:hypothetical protein